MSVAEANADLRKSIAQVAFGQPKPDILSFLKPYRSLILGVVGAGCAFGFALLLPFFFDGAAHYQFLNFFPIRLIAISFKPLVA
jgi:hypothetical protein